MATGGDPEEYVYTELTEELLPCEFCELLFPSDLLLEHTTGCRPDLCSYVRSNDDGNDNSETNDTGGDNSASDDDDLNHLINSIKATPKDTVDTKINNQNVEQVVCIKKENHTKPEPVENLLKTDLNLLPIKNSSDKVYNLKTKEVAFKKSPAKTTTLNKRRSALNNATKHDGTKRVGYDFSNDSIQNNFDEIVTAEDEEVLSSSDDDDNYETIENFWKRAATVLEKRLSESYDVKSQKGFQVSNMTGKVPTTTNFNPFQYKYKI